MHYVAIACLLLASACGEAVSPGDPDAGTDDAPDAGDSSAAGPDYDALFPDDHVVAIAIDVHDDGWETIVATSLEDIYVPADVTWDGVTVPDVMIRLKGNSSRNGPLSAGSERYSLKIDFDRTVAGQTLHGIDKINLNNGWNDPTQLREVLATELFAAAGVPSPQMAFGQVTINGDLMGLYVVVEQLGKEFLERHFDDEDGDLYKPEPPAGHLAYEPNGDINIEQLDLKTNEDTSDHAAMYGLLDVLNYTDQAGLEAALEQVVDVERYLRYLAISALIVNLDSPLGPGHNFYLYEDRANGGRFAVVPWDMNGTFATFNCGYSYQQLAGLSYDQPWCVAPPDSQQQLLPRRIMSVPGWVARYHELLDELSSTVFVASTIDARIAELADMIRPYVYEDPTRQYPADLFDEGLTGDVRTGNRTLFGLESLVDQRLAALGQQLGM
jgi:hypothetical protein